MEEWAQLPQQSPQGLSRPLMSTNEEGAQHLRPGSIGASGLSRPVEASSGRRGKGSPT